MLNFGTIKTVFHRSVLITKKYSPEILLGVGIGGGIVSTVMACKATLKIEEVKKNAVTRVEKLTEDAATIFITDPDLYTAKDFEKDLRIIKVQEAFSIVKLYLPSVTVGLLSIGAIVGSHNILTGRYLAVLSAYNLVDAAFRKYRERVIESMGPEGDLYFRHGSPEQKFAEGVKKVEGKEGESLPKCYIPTGEESMYAKFFDSSSVQWKKNNELNEAFLLAQQRFANQLLQSRGHVFLNEVYDSLGLPRTPAGAVVGWLKDHGDNVIDFGIYAPANSQNRDFVNGYGDVLLLDFNVDGMIYEMI